MTSRDPPARHPGLATAVGDGVREATQSIDIEAEEEVLPAELAHGTHERPGARPGGPPGTPATRIESPGARGKTQPPARPAPRPGRSDSPDEYIGAVLGSYRVIELLGKGGMGSVYRAEHTRLGREVALKLLRGDYASRRDAVARFFHEARTVHRARHRNIVDVTDFVELDDGTTYIVMELLTGTGLGAWARRGVELPRALGVLVQICDGLAAAHQVGVVHRDLKPDNVIIVPTPDGAELAKLLDFGVAKLLNREDEDVGFQTAAGAVIGTPAYMSPEQAGGMVIDARSDIYSLGAMMYELFCSQPMFRGRSFGEYVRKHLTEMPVPPRQTAGGAAIDPRLEAVILRCLEKDPAQRYAQIGELREALLHLLGAGDASTSTRMPRQISQPGSTIPPALPAPAAPLELATTTPVPVVHPGHPGHPGPAAPRPTPWWVWFAGGGLAVGVGVAAAILLPRSDAPAAPAALTAPSPRPAPAAVAPAPSPPPPTRRPLVELRFASVPNAGVFVAGKTTELCRTPCAFNVDLSDGRGDRRDFVVKRPGYLDGEIAVDLTTAERDFRVVLQPAGRPTRRPAKRPTRSPAADPPAADPAPAPPAPAPAPAPAKAPSRPAIDPSDTLDPFQPKK